MLQLHTQTHYTHIHTLHKKQTSKAKSLAATKRSRRPSEALGCLGTTQALRASAWFTTHTHARTHTNTNAHTNAHINAHTHTHTNTLHTHSHTNTLLNSTVKTHLGSHHTCIKSVCCAKHTVLPGPWCALIRATNRQQFYPTRSWLRQWHLDRWVLQE